VGLQEGTRVSDRRKLLNYIRASDSDPSWPAKLPLFTAEIKQIFMTEELRTYFATTRVSDRSLTSLPSSSIR
jgi:hypothetical protein